MTRRRFPLFNKQSLCVKCGCETPANIEYCAGLVKNEWDKKCGQLALAHAKSLQHSSPTYSSHGFYQPNEIRNMSSLCDLYAEEHIHRTCHDCGYIWIEETLDKGHSLEQLGAAAQ